MPHPLPVINDVYRCVFNWHNPNLSRYAHNVIHVKKSGSNSAAVWAALDANATAAMWSMQGSDSAVESLTITPLDGHSVSFPVFTGTPAKWTGASTSGHAIPQACNIIKFLTATRGRSYRGRAYLPWIVEGVQEAGVLDGADVIACTNAWVAWLAAMTTAGFVPQVASYKLATSDPIIAVTCEPTTATQRRRQRS